MSTTTLVKMRLDHINTSPAESVRVASNLLAIDEYKRAYADGIQLPPPDVFTWTAGRTVRGFMGDGFHRYLAWQQAEKGDSMEVLCHACGSKQEAERAAYAHAVGANDGLRRTPEDKAQAILTALSRPENAPASVSDRDIGRMCKVHHTTVSSRRFELTNEGILTGEAASTNPARGYKQDAKIRGGCTRNGDGKVRPTTQASEPEPSNRTNVSAGDSSTPTPPDEDVAIVPMGKPSDVVKDARGRIVPKNLEPLFVAGWAFVKEGRDTLNELVKAAQDASNEPWGKALIGTMQAIEIDAKNLREAFRCGVPAVCCPHIGPNGQHDLSGKCQVCIGNRGWLTAGNFEQLMDGVKEICDERAKESISDAEAEAA